jgi:uncharacterized membrane protein YjfL (UPF0719 family)
MKHAQRIFQSVLVFFPLFLFLPQSVAAATLKELVNKTILPIGDSIIQLLYALAFILVLIGMVRYFFLTDGEENRTKGKQFIVWGLAGLVILFSVWGVVQILLKTLTSASL